YSPRVCRYLSLSRCCCEYAANLEPLDSAFNASNVTRLVYGTAANAAAVLLYGSNFVPVKRIETGDGMFFQWVTCAAIWVVSMVGNLILHSPKFYPFAMLGGAIWATVVPIVKAIGLSLGVLIWGSSSLLMGWASSRFGWFGIAAEDVSRPILNYCGAGLCLLSGLIFFFVRSDVELHPNSESTPLLIDRRTHSDSYGPISSEFWMDVSGPKTKKFIGCLLAVVSGVLYGLFLVPVLYIKSHSSSRDSVFQGASIYELDYVFALCSGTFLASTVYFAIYCAAMKNRPRVYGRAILPGLSAGVMWTLGTYCWFLANNYLSAVITFPIVSAGKPDMLIITNGEHSSLQGFANSVIFVLAICAVLTGSLLTAFSKL
uniref:Uncharacterized protein n=1 Tax=Mola mola TaxID=94237 RepID=A0A3Q3VUJ7_MOLML